MARVFFTFDSGSIASAAALIRTRASNYLAKNSRNWLVVGLNKIVGYKGPLLLAGVEGGKQMMSAAESYASLGTATTDGLGSVFRVLTALFFIGAGAVRYNGLSTGAVATSTLSLRLLENGLYNGATLQAGLAQPSAPSIFVRTAGSGFTGTRLIAGTHSVEIWRIRSSTGAISIASLPSNVVVSATGQTIVITFPLPSANGDDRWGIAATKAGFGEFGPFYEINDVTEIPESEIATTTLLDGAITATKTTLTSLTAVFTVADIGKEIIIAGADTAGADLLTTIASWNSATSVEVTDMAITSVVAAQVEYNGIVDGVLRSVEMEWTDGQLAGQNLAPIDDFPPPPAIFGGTLNDTGFLDGAYGDTATAPAILGASIVVSLPLKFESWPPDQILFAPQPATAISSRAADGYAYRAGKSSLGALVYTGGFPAISFQLRWPNAGCLAPHNMVIAEQGRLYIWTAQHGLARIGDGDEPETDFAIPIWDEVADWNAIEVVLGWDGGFQMVCACYRKLIKPFNSQIDRWGTLCDLTGKIRGNIIAAVTANSGDLYLCCNNVRTVADLTTIGGSAVVTSPTAVFTTDDIGKTVILTESSAGRIKTDGAITATDATLTSATAAFTAADVGKTITVNGAGAAGADLVTTIASLNSATSVELTVVAGTTVSGATFHYGGTGTLTTTIAGWTSATQVTLTANVTWTATATTTIAIDTTLRLYSFNTGTGMVSEAYTPWIPTDDESDNVFGVGGAVVIDDNSNPVTLRLLANGDPANVAREWQVYLPTDGANVQHLYTERPNLINTKSHALYVKIIGAGGETSLDSLYSERDSDQVVISG